MDKDKLSGKEEQLFRDLDKEMQPPSYLEKKIVSQLVKEGLLNKKKTKYAYLKTAASIAAAVLIFFGGTIFEKSRTDASTVFNPELAYMLLLHEDENFNQGSPIEMAREYGNWMQKTKNSGINMVGHELKASGAILDSHKGVVMLTEDQAKKTTGILYSKPILLKKPRP